MTRQCAFGDGKKKLAIFPLSYFLLLILGVGPVNATVSGEVATGAPQAAVITALANAGAALPPAFTFAAKAAPPGPPGGYSDYGGIGGDRGDRDGRGEKGDRDDKGDRDGKGGKGDKGDKGDRDGGGDRDGRGGRGGNASPCR